jgi:hypothetical protein
MTTAALLLRERDAAAQLAVCPRTLRKWRQDGDIEYILIGRSIRYSITDLDRFIAARKTRCACSKEPEAPFGGTTSPSNIIDFENLRANLRGANAR